MLDDLNENNDNLTDNAASQGEQDSPLMSGGEVENAPQSYNETGTESDASTSRGEDANSISADLIRGHINTIILRALYERDKYGYEIINDIESKSHGQYTLKQPTLYSALKRLENQGYIKAYWKTDEVTLGGRRKYFTLTESGKAITEKNLAEWEYSRTIIDSLISDKSFDFANPAPTAVDFSLLRDSVSRVPTVRGEDRQTGETHSQPSEPTAQELISQFPTQTTNSVSFTQAVEYGCYNVDKEENTQTPTNQPIQGDGTSTNQSTQAQSNEQQASQESQTQQNVEQQAAQELAAQQVAQQQAEQQAEQQQAEQEAQEAEARRRTHENYMRLISEPVRQKPIQVEDTVPGSDNTNTDKLLYNNRPETERDYRNLIDGIFFKTIYHGSVQTTYHTRQSDGTQSTRQRSQQIDMAGGTRLKDRAASDGVRITPSNERNSSRASKTTYNKGATLLKSSAVVLAILIIEAILCYIFMDTLTINWVYPAVILAIGIVQFGVFAVMAISGYGKRSVLPTSHGYISGCIIISILIVLIIAASSFLLNINMSIASDILKKLVIPSITALNLTVFGICFRLFIK